MHDFTFPETGPRTLLNPGGSYTALRLTDGRLALIDAEIPDIGFQASVDIPGGPGAPAKLRPADTSTTFSTETRRYLTGVDTEIHQRQANTVIGRQSTGALVAGVHLAGTSPRTAWVLARDPEAIRLGSEADRPELTEVGFGALIQGY